MGKQVFILNCKQGDAGVAKILSNKNKINLTLNLNKKFPEIKKCHIVGVDKTVKTLEFKRNKYNFEFSFDSPIENVYLSSEDDKNILVWSGEMPKATTDVIAPDFLTFENFLGGGFRWNKIRGNILMYNYSILHYIISDNFVYRSINKAGFYACGIKKENNIVFIVVAIPVKENENPYKNLNVDTYTIYTKKSNFCALCVGIDDTGEFFVSI